MTAIYTKRFDLVAPVCLDFKAPPYVHKWEKVLGDMFYAGERLLLLTDGILDADGLVGLRGVYAPCHGVLEDITIYAKEPAPVGSVLGHLRVEEDFQMPSDRDWQSYDQLMDIISRHLEKTNHFNEKKDINDVLAELLGLDEEGVFSKLPISEQNVLIQHHVKEYSSKGLSPLVIAQQLLQRLDIRPPTPAAPAMAPTLQMGLRPNVPSLGGGGNRSTRMAQSTPPLQGQEE